jgi:hypothetical protein
VRPLRFRAIYRRALQALQVRARAAGALAGLQCGQPQSGLGTALHGVDLDIATARVKPSKVILPHEEFRYEMRTSQTLLILIRFVKNTGNIFLHLKSQKRFSAQATSCARSCSSL